MNIELLGGKNEIGGNKILVEHKGTKLLLDFGMSFGQYAKFFSEFLKPRKCAALTDFFQLGLLPDLKGIYREDYVKHIGRPLEEKEIDAVFLTHAHADHAQYIHFLRPDIPICCTTATKIILQVLEKTGNNTYSDFTTCNTTFTFYENSKGEESRVTRKQSMYTQPRDFKIMQPNLRINIGSLEIEMVPVDHSLPGACGFIIYSDEGSLVYTGDIRFHGSHSKLSKHFVEKAKSIKPRWLISEGTRIDQEEIQSEAEVKQKVTHIIKNAAGLVFVEFPIRDLDRANTIYESAKVNNRKFVVNLKLAYLINKLGDLCPFNLDNVEILVPKKGWGLISKKEVKQKHIEHDYETWEREYIFRKNCITHTELRKNPQHYVVTMNMWEINQLTDIQPQNAIWIKSSCEPFCEEMELDEERKQNWLKHFNIKEYKAHASGHATGNEIRAMIKEINPQEIIPIHTEHPEMLK